jgi:hypothetical protein
MRVVKVICCAAMLTAILAPSARADQWDKKTILTFSGAVQVPGATLPAGSYVFKLADIPGNRHVVQVFDKDEKKIYTTILAIPNDRLEATDKPVVLFAERASGSPQAVKVWYYPGERTGDEFVYPKSQAMRIAKASHERVLAYNDDKNSESMTNTAGEVPSSMKSAEVGYFDENGNWQSENRTIAVNGNRTANTADRAAANTRAETSTAADRDRAAANTPAPTTARNETAQPTGTSGAKSERRHLPRTASSLALFELLSGIALGSGLIVRTLRTRAAEAN